LLAAFGAFLMLEIPSECHGGSEKCGEKR